MWYLKSYSNCPPGNYFFIQHEGIQHQFRSNPVIEETAKAVSSFRTANRLPRASLVESLEDVDAFTAMRLHHDERFCFDTAIPFSELRNNHQFFRKACSTCGTPAK